MPSRNQYTAAGNISPSRFLVVATATAFPFGVTQATGDAVAIVGISQSGTRNAGGTAADDGFAAIAGGQLTVFDDPYEDQPLLLLGLPVTQGQLLTSDALGRGVPVTATGQWIGARATQSQASGTLARVQPLFGRNGG